MARRHRIAVIPGDGIGKETTPEGLRVQILDAENRAMFTTGSAEPNEA